MKIVKSIFIAFTLLLIAAACKNPEQLKPEEDTNPQKPIVYTSELTDNLRSAGSSTPLGITYVEIVGNQMSVKVKYSGGCKKHDFKLFGHKLISKSLPPQRAIKIVHAANGDDCREIIEEILIFDVSNLAYGKEEVVFILDGYEERISYTPVP